jgi:4-diphosphocytidyl-2-C-methyl-D-erythritol kinase
MTFTSTGLKIPGPEKENLILKAYYLLKKDFNTLPSMDVHLHKNIPIGAGLGGGSADAAFALKLMNNFFDLHLEEWLLEEYAAQIGSDCPFFIENKPKIAKGRGEILEPVDLELKDNWLVLINPGLHIETKEAYAGVTPQKPTFDLRETLANRELWKDRLTNDFEESVFTKHPGIATIKTRLYEAGAFYAALSGSGSTIFGLFDQEPELGIWPKGYFTFKGEM